MIRIHGDRQTGRTTRLVEEAAKLQEEVPVALVLFIAPYVQRAQFLSGVVHASCMAYTQGERGCIPDQTIVIGVWKHGKLRGYSSPAPHHKVFAFIDDSDEFPDREWDELLRELEANRIAIGGVVSLD